METWWRDQWAGGKEGVVLTAGSGVDFGRSHDWKRAWWEKDRTVKKREWEAGNWSPTCWGCWIWLPPLLSLLSSFALWPPLASTEWKAAAEAGSALDGE